MYIWWGLSRIYVNYDMEKWGWWLDVIDFLKYLYNRCNIYNMQVKGYFWAIKEGRRLYSYIIICNIKKCIWPGLLAFDPVDVTAVIAIFDLSTHVLFLCLVVSGVGAYKE